MPTNGKLDGFWQLVEIEELENGAIVDVKEFQRFWTFQLDLMSFRTSQGTVTPGYQEAFCRFQVIGNELVVSSIYLHPLDDRGGADDLLVTDEATTMFRPYGVWGCKDKFRIEQLSSSSMKLCSEYVRLTFRKY